MSQRLSRINELMKREISAFIERSFEFPDVLVTIHDVETAVDLRSAMVHIGVIGTPEQTREVLRQLNNKRGVIQNAVVKRVVIRNTPQLTFLVDDSVERGVRILNILDEIGEIRDPEPGEDAEFDLNKRPRR
jgi:ribosome-binding factor A